MRKRYELSGDQISKFLEIGIRPIEARHNEWLYTKDLIGNFFLVPTFKGEWIRQHAKYIKSSWEGSAMPLLIYKSKIAVILVDHKETEVWEPVILKIENALGMPVNARGD